MSAATVLVVGACGSPAAPSLPEPAATRGPLEAVLHRGDADIPMDGSDTRAAMLVLVRQQEEAVAACMQALGFEYTPQVPAVADVVVHQGLDPASRAYAEQDGYGLWTSPDQQLGTLEWTLPADPEQQAYLAGMSTTTRAAYDDALAGPVISTGADDSVLREGGCRDQAAGFSADDALQSVVDEAWAFLADLDTDPRFADLDRAWATCLADAGFDADSPAAARREIEAELTSWLETAQEMPDDVDERAADERALALADWDCQDATDYPAQHRTIEHALQQDYVDDHRDDLDAWLDAASASASSEGES